MKQTTTNRTIPLSLAIDQVKSYRYAFQEAVRKANRAIMQRDYFHSMALQLTCSLMHEVGNCPDDIDDPCPSILGGYCQECRRRVDLKARYL